MATAPRAKHRPTKAEAEAQARYHYMAEAMRALERDLRRPIAETGLIPPEWHRIAQHRGPGPKLRLTLWVEEDVLRFFKGMGRGHTTRMAEVLKTFMLARLAGVVQGAEAVDYAAEADRPLTRRLNDLRAQIAARAAKEGKFPPVTFEERLAAVKAEHKARMERRKRARRADGW